MGAIQTFHPDGILTRDASDTFEIPKYPMLRKAALFGKTAFCAGLFKLRMLMSMCTGCGVSGARTKIFVVSLQAGIT